MRQLCYAGLWTTLSKPGDAFLIRKSVEFCSGVDIRHGQLEFNAAFDGNGDPMIFDAPLTELGKQQAIAARIKVADLQIAHIISSPLTRALQTSLHLFGETAPIKVETGHHELLLHSCDVGRTPRELEVDFPQLAFDHLPERWWHHQTGKPLEIAVEPDHLFENRIENFVQTLESITTRPLAVVGHGNAFKKIMGRMLENCEIHRYR